ncbi:MAG: DUF167 domain-containing protein [Deltaproteobacteria bacterium]|nr:DUF167 domain-containing protein [Deltaproteobacteria bacterium]
MRATDPAALLELLVQPRASRSEVVGWQGAALRVRVTAPAVEGAASQACLDLLAELLGVARSSLTIVRGARVRRKLVRVAGLSPDELRCRLSSTVRTTG